MQTCQNCGTTNPDGQRTCSTCGSQLPQFSYQPYQQSAPAYQQPYQQNYQQANQQSYQQNYQQPYQQSYQQPYQQKPADYPAGGLIAWSIITLLLCTIPGIIALINVAQINNCATVEEQQKKISTTKICCIIGTILGTLSLLGVLLSRS